MKAESGSWQEHKSEFLTWHKVLFHFEGSQTLEQIAQRDEESLYSKVFKTHVDKALCNQFSI